MDDTKLDKLVWPLIYAGMFIAGLGIWFMEHRPSAAWSLLIGGGTLIGIGALLIWLRSRRP
jgi:hypothetical protein